MFPPILSTKEWSLKFSLFSLLLQINSCYYYYNSFSLVSLTPVSHYFNLPSTMSSSLFLKWKLFAVFKTHTQKAIQENQVQTLYHIILFNRTSNSLASVDILC